MPTTQPIPADDAEVDASPLAKRLRCDRSKAVRFSPAVKALGGGLSQRQGQPLATLQLTSLAEAFSHEGPRQALYPVAESRESTPLGPSMRPGTDDSTQMREGSTDELAATANRASSSHRVGGPGTPELSTAVRLLPRTPHFDAIARAAAGSSLDGEAEQSPPARSAPQAADAAPLESPLRRIQEATASLMQQLRNVDAATSQIRAYPTLPPPLTPARSHVALPSGSRTALQPLQAEEPPQSLLMPEVNAARQEQPPPEAPANPAEPPPLQANACHAPQHAMQIHAMQINAVHMPCSYRASSARAVLVRGMQRSCHAPASAPHAHAIHAQCTCPSTGVAAQPHHPRAASTSAASASVNAASANAARAAGAATIASASAAIVCAARARGELSWRQRPRPCHRRHRARRRRARRRRARYHRARYHRARRYRARCRHFRRIPPSPRPPPPGRPEAPVARRSSARAVLC